MREGRHCGVIPVVTFFWDMAWVNPHSSPKGKAWLWDHLDKMRGISLPRFPGAFWSVRTSQESQDCCYDMAFLLWTRELFP